MNKYLSDLMKNDAVATIARALLGSAIGASGGAVVGKLTGKGAKKGALYGASIGGIAGGVPGLYNIIAKKIGDIRERKRVAKLLEDAKGNNGSADTTSSRYIDEADRENSLKMMGITGADPSTDYINYMENSQPMPDEWVEFDTLIPRDNKVRKVTGLDDIPKDALPFIRRVAEDIEGSPNKARAYADKDMKNITREWTDMSPQMKYLRTDSLSDALSRLRIAYKTDPDLVKSVVTNAALHPIDAKNAYDATGGMLFGWSQGRKQMIAENIWKKNPELGDRVYSVLNAIKGDVDKGWTKDKQKDLDAYNGFLKEYRQWLFEPSNTEKTDDEIRESENPSEAAKDLIEQTMKYLNIKKKE